MLAQAGERVPVFDQVITLAPTWALIVQALSPLLIAAASKYRGGDHTVHKVLAAVITALVGTVAMLTDDVPNDNVGSIISTFVQLGVTQMAAYVLAWSPAKVNERVLPENGLGADPPVGRVVVDTQVVSEAAPQAPSAPTVTAFPSKEEDGPPRGQH